MLRNQVCGVNDSHILRRLLSEPDLTVKTSMQIALGMETAAQNAKTFWGGDETSAATLGEVLKSTGAETGGSKQQIPSCTCCGKPGHHQSKSRLKDAKCHHCDKVGHIKRACEISGSVQTLHGNIRDEWIASSDGY